VVRAATAASSVSGSCRGRASSESPTQIESKPSPSAFSSLHHLLAGRQQVSDAWRHCGASDVVLPSFYSGYTGIDSRFDIVRPSKRALAGAPEGRFDGITNKPSS
jgi:hypothetical protein